MIQSSLFSFAVSDVTLYHPRQSPSITKYEAKIAYTTCYIVT